MSLQVTSTIQVTSTLHVHMLHVMCTCVQSTYVSRHVYMCTKGVNVTHTRFMNQVDLNFHSTHPIWEVYQLLLPKFVVTAQSFEVGRVNWYQRFSFLAT